MKGIYSYIRGVAIKFRKFSYNLETGNTASFVNVFLETGDLPFSFSPRLKSIARLVCILSVEDDPREGAPITSRTDANVDRLCTLITSDQRLSIHALADELNVDKETVHKILHENLNMRKICGKIVPKVLTCEQRDMRKSICEDLLSCIRSNSRDWMSQVVTEDETGIFGYDPETRKQSQQWVEKGEEWPTKARMSKSRLKAMLIWSNVGIVV